MNLRFLTLINISFQKDQHQNQDRTEHKFEEDKLKDLIDNILSNINKFRNILDSKQSYFIKIPGFKDSELTSNQDRDGDRADQQNVRSSYDIPHSNELAEGSSNSPPHQNNNPNIIRLNYQQMPTQELDNGAC